MTVNGMAGIEVISILDPCWGLEINGKSVAHAPFIAKFEISIQ